jgi:NADP-dependent 3-hydroxy acid dehydrogenase YdfG
MATNWGRFDPAERSEPATTSDGRDSLDPNTVADLIAWMVSNPGHPVLNEVTITPLRETGWP